MGYAFAVALRSMRGSSRSRTFVSLGTALATLGVALGVAALAVVLSVTAGLHAQLCATILSVEAPVTVVSHASLRDPPVAMNAIERVPGVTAVAPFFARPRMISRGTRIKVHALVKGVDPERFSSVLDLGRYVREGSLEGLRGAGEKNAKHEKIRAAPRPSPADPFASAAEHHERISLFDAIRKRIDEDRAPSPANGRQSDNQAAQKEVPERDAARRSVDDDHDPLTEEQPENLCATDATTEVTTEARERLARLPGLVIGRALSERLEAHLGDCVQLTSLSLHSAGSSGIAGSAGTMAVAKAFRVQAIFESGFEAYDENLVFTDIYAARSFEPHAYDEVTGFDVNIAQANRASVEVAARVQAELSALRDGVFETTSWRDRHRGLFTALRVQQVATSLVIALILLMAAFSVMATRVIFAIEKKSEIAALKALGASKYAILRIFLYQGAILGVAGSNLGLFAAFGICHFLSAYSSSLDSTVYFVSKLSLQVHPFGFAAAALIAVGLCVFVSFFPALFAVRLSPAGGLRGK